MARGMSVQLLYSYTIKVSSELQEWQVLISKISLNHILKNFFLISLFFQFYTLQSPTIS